MDAFRFVPIGLAVIQHGRVVHVNAPLADISGYTVEELRKFSQDEILRMIGAETPRKAQYGEAVRRTEAQVQTKNGERRWFKSITSQIDHEGQPALRIACLDITECKQREAAGKENLLSREDRSEPLGSVGQRHAVATSERRELPPDSMNLMGSNRQVMARPLILAHEEERLRISRELHDQAAEALTALRLNLKQLAKQANLASGRDQPSDLPTIVEGLESAVVLCDLAMEPIRQLVHGFHAAAPDNPGLDLSLEGYCQEFSKRTGISIDYSGCELPRLPAAVESCLYRFAQECLAVTARHAEPTDISVSVHLEEERIRLEVHVNGGLQPEGKQKELEWIGMMELEERLDVLGGGIHIESPQGRGTRLLAEVPLGSRAWLK